MANFKSNVKSLYHGSDHIIENPVFGEGKSYNDYGRGFYCTEHVELAKEWACALGGDGYANHYKLDMSGLSVLNLNTQEYNILNWLAILLENRKFNVYFSYAGDFENGTLSLSDLSEAMRLGKLGEQVVLKSKKAFEALTFVEGIKAPREEYFAKYKQRDEEARNKYRKIATKPVVEDEIYVIDIIRNNWKNGQSI